MPRKSKLAIMKSPEWQWWNERLQLIKSEVRRRNCLDRILYSMQNNWDMTYWRDQMEYVRLNHLYGDDWQKVGWVEPSKQY